MKTDNNKDENIFINALKLDPIDIHGYTNKNESINKNEITDKNSTQILKQPNQLLQERNPVSSKLNVPDELIVAGIPLVVSALMGRPSIGAKIAGKHIVESEQAKIEDGRNERLRRTQDDNTLKQYMDDEGNIIWGTPNEAHGRKTSSFSNQLNRRLDYAKGKSDIDLGKFKEKESYKDIGSAVSDSEKKFKDYAGQNMKALIDFGKITTAAKDAMKNPDQAVLLATAIKQYASMLEKGKLTDFDVQMVSEPISYLKGIDERIFKELRGKSPERVIKQILDASNKIGEELVRSIEKAKRQISDKAGIVRGSGNDDYYFDRNIADTVYNKIGFDPYKFYNPVDLTKVQYVKDYSKDAINSYTNDGKVTFRILDGPNAGRVGRLSKEKLKSKSFKYEIID